MANRRDPRINGDNISGNDIFGQFLNPEAMLTPGIAGALVMFITNGLASNFPISRVYTGLFLSFILGLLVLVANRPWWVKAVYYLVNSLIIFVVAFGANGIGSGVAAARLDGLNFRPISTAVAESVGTAKNSTGASIAQVPSSERHDSSVRSRTELEETIKRQQAIIEQLKKESSQKNKESPLPNSFFAPWTFKR